jgi:hypothetical protein
VALKPCTLLVQMALKEQATSRIEKDFDTGWHGTPKSDDSCIYQKIQEIF